MGHTYCPVRKISKYLVLCTRDVTISCYGLAHISCVQVNFELLTTYWVKKLGANQAVCAFCFHAQCCILKREVVSVYFVTTINTKKKLSESKIHKNGQKCFFFCVCVCVCLHYSANSIIYKKICRRPVYQKIIAKVSNYRQYRETCLSLFLPYWSFQLYVSVRKCPSALV